MPAGHLLVASVAAPVTSIGLHCRRAVDVPASARQALAIRLRVQAEMGRRSATSAGREVVVLNCLASIDQARAAVASPAAATAPVEALVPAVAASPVVA